jgi:hypothetical protein
MKMRPFYMVFLCCLISFPLSAQTITWNKARKLQWSDFKGKVTDTTAAGSVVGVRFVPVNYHTAIKKGRYKASAVFDSNRSFHVPARSTDYLLKHERLHFDVAAIFAARLQRLADKKGLLSEREAKMMFIELNTDLRAYQEKYDEQTVHGTDIEAQSRWQKLISTQLP